jgi:uncharacterized DUF497 family protein
MKFEWDEAKCKANVRKHGIDFVDASQVFAGEFVVIEDERCDYGELRFIAFGLLFGEVVVVAYTTPNDDTVRVISMRKATTSEARNFFRHISN